MVVDDSKVGKDEENRFCQKCELYIGGMFVNRRRERIL